MSKHTPGPWIARKAQFGGSAFGIVGPDDAPVAMTASNSSPKGMEMARRGEIEANARLIAAAPDLLEALREVWASSDKFNADHSISRTPAMQRMYLRAQAAIAKAEGT